jgi:hypothetical protein
LEVIGLDAGHREGDAMSATILGLEYFHATVKDRPGAAFQLLSDLASSRVNLLAFSVVPIGPEYAQLVLFPEVVVERLIAASKKHGFEITGPHHAFLIQGDDRLGALVEIHGKLAEADINVYASTGVTDGRGGYGYMLYVRPDEFNRAAQVLGV